MATPRDLRRAMLAVAICGAVFSLAMLAFGGPSAGWSTAAGSAVVVLNLYALHRALGQRMAAPQTRGAVARILASLTGILRIFALYIGVWLLLKKGVVDPIPFVVGLMSLPAGLVSSSMRSSGRGKEGPPSKNSDA